MDSGLPRISSRRTFFNKRLFPIFWFGFVVLWIVIVFSQPGGAPRPVFLIPVIMLAFGFLLMKKLVWDLVDEVYDGGDHLVVRNRGEEERIALTDIMNVGVASFQNPPRVTLRLTRPCVFGEEIAFIPAVGWWHWPFSRIKVADDLIMRVHQARTGRETTRPLS